MWSAIGHPSPVDALAGFCAQLSLAWKCKSKLKLDLVLTTDKANPDALRKKKKPGINSEQHCDETHGNTFLEQSMVETYYTIDGGHEANGVMRT